jgi:hypothetical protein
MAAQGPVSAALGADQPAYRISGLRAANPAQRLSLRFSAGGVSVASGATRLRLGLAGVGRPRAMHTVQPVSPRVTGNRATYPHRGVSEWYTNGPLGLEQGFTVRARPAGEGPLTLSLGLSSTHARLGGGKVLFGGTLNYGGLFVTDASGRPLRSWLALTHGRLLIRVADRGAGYPLRIDPFVQQGLKLTANDESVSGSFGYAVALSADGNTALVGGDADNGNVGAAWVFVRSNRTWSQQGSKLIGNCPSSCGGPNGTGEAGKGFFGSSVALSSDGNTALIGAHEDNTNVGAAWVFTRSNGTWYQQGSKLVGNCVFPCGGPDGTGEIGSGGFGTSVALSSNGNTALIGAYGDNSGAGAAWVFTLSGGTWSQQGPKLTGGNANFGYDVSLSSDGNTALIGGWSDNGLVGAAWVFNRSGTSWAQQGSKLTANDESGAGRFGYSVALSGDGQTAVIGGPFDGSAGAAWVFVRSNGMWSQRGSKLTPNDESGSAAFGASVGLSSDGNSALIGGPQDSSGVGAAWLFTPSASGWIQRGSKLTGTGESGNGNFGVVALSSDGNTAMIGAASDNSSVGAAWPFVAQHNLTAAKAGSGSGTVTSSPAGINCGTACSAIYTAGTHVTLAASPAAGSGFTGWSGGGCAGTGTCTVTLNSDQTVTARFALKKPTITAKIDRKHHKATFRFKALGASGFQCALIRPAKTHTKHPKPHFAACKSPKTYKHLKKGKYTFEVRAISSAGTSAAATHRFKA